MSEQDEEQNFEIMFTPNCNNVVTEKKQKAKSQIGIN